MTDVKRSRRGAEHSDNEEGPDADLTVGILAKHKKRLEAAEGTRSAEVAAGSKGHVSAEDDGRQTGTPEADGEANPPKKKRKKGALDRLEERERSSTPGSERQDSDHNSSGRKKKKKRKAFHEVDAASLEGKGVSVEQIVRSSEPSSEEEGQILEQFKEPVYEGSYATGNGLTNNGNGLRLDKWNLDLNIQETTSERKKASKVRNWRQMFVFSAEVPVRPFVNIRVWRSETPASHNNFVDLLRTLPHTLLICIGHRSSQLKSF
jgi:hypothetical protein